MDGSLASQCSRLGWALLGAAGAERVARCRRTVRPHSKPICWRWAPSRTAAGATHPATKSCWSRCPRRRRASIPTGSPIPANRLNWITTRTACGAIRRLKCCCRFWCGRSRQRRVQGGGVAAGSGAGQSTGRCRCDSPATGIHDPPSQVRFTARIKVVDMKSGHVLGTQVFEAVEPAPSENAYGAVRATNAAVVKVLGEMVPFALQYVR